MRELDTQAYVGALKELVEEGHEVSLRIAGSSMAPFLVHQRDTIFFRKPHRELRVGDMVFYRRRNGQYVMHRIVRIRDGGYYLVGDAQQEIEGPLDRCQIFALVTAVERKGRLLRPGSFWWEFFARVWLRMIPMRRWIMKVYGKLRLL